MNANNNELAAKIAAHLPGWRFDNRKAEDCYWPRIFCVAPVGPAFHLVQYHRDKMIRVSGHGGRSDGIKFNPNRDPKAIAADIQRRFLPDYLAAYAKATAQRDQEKQARQTFELELQSLVKVGVRLCRRDGDRRAILTTDDLCITSDWGSYHVEMRNVDCTQVHRLLTFLRQQGEGREIDENRG